MILHTFRTVVLFVSALFLWVWPAGAQPLDLHHQLDLTLHPDRHLLEAADEVRLSPAPRQLAFWLNPAAEIESIRQGINALPYTFADGQLVITFPPGNYNALATADIRYRLKLPQAMPVQPAHHEDPSYGIAAALGPLGGFLGEGARWFPQVQEVRPTVDIRIRVPRGWEAVTHGTLIERHLETGSTVLRWQTRLNQPAMALAAGPWDFGETTEGTVPIYTFFSNANAGLAERYQSAAAGYLAEYSERLGPYPFTKFAVAENFFPSGYGYASWTLLGKRVIRLPFILRTSLPHEIVHNWFGNGVLVDYAEGNWSEGLTSYLADYFQKEKGSPEDALAHRRKILRDYASLVSPGTDYPLRQFHYRQSAMDQAIGYGKAMMVFHMLRQKIGDEAFWKGLRLLTRQRMNLPTRWDHLQRAFEISARQPLGEFFSQWTQRPGLPQLQLAGVESRLEDGRYHISGHLLQQGAPYRLDIPLRLTTRMGATDSILELHGKDRRFSLTSADPPLRLEVDPEVHLLRKLYPSEIPPTVNSIRGSQNLLVVLSSTVDRKLAERAQLLLASLRQELAPITSELELSPQHLKGRDVLFIGLPRNPALLPALPENLKLSPKGFTLNGRTFADRHDVLFTVLPHPNSQGRAAALFVPRTGLDAEIAARKIPHYGKYSTLVFRSGVNRVKSTWPPEDSPLIHHFTQSE